MQFNILTLFPEMFKGPFGASILARAREKELIDIKISDIRDFSNDKHNTVDDAPYGGGAGMVLKAGPIHRAWKSIKQNGKENFSTVLLSPQGKRLEQNKVNEFSQKDGLILICGHYEGVDERIRKSIVDEEISIGDYVLTGGELPAMVLVDAVARMVDGVLGDDKSSKEDSFYNGLLEYPHYTRPQKYEDMEVPDILLSGHHGNIAKWRKKMALKRTLLRRADLLEKKELTAEEKELLKEIKNEIKGENNGKN